LLWLIIVEFDIAIILDDGNQEVEGITVLKDGLHERWEKIQMI
jgi:hypothetical protein